MTTGITPERPWRAACLWLLLLGPGFFLLYGAANHYAATLPAERIGNIAKAWERAIPLLPWTIVPYWSIDLLYGISLFLCTSQAEVNAHAKRLLAVTVLSCLSFALFPLRFGFIRPPLDGVFGHLFDLLMGFDKPFNQAPSLHIGLLTVLWLRYWQHVPRGWHWLLHGWFFLIGISVLTTWQHHFWDVPSGFALAVLVCYCLPMPGEPQLNWRMQPGSRRMAGRYGCATLLLAGAAVCLRSWALLLLWPALSLSLLTSGYALFGPAVMQKQMGRRRFAARVLLFPYSLVTYWVHCYFLRRLPPAQQVAADVWVGPLRAARDPRFVAVLDLAAEYDRQARPGVAYRSLPLLDLQLPRSEELQRGVSELEALRREHAGPLLVHCALGLTRSACVVLAWLMASRRAATLDQAWALLCQRRDRVELSPAQLRALDGLCAQLEPL